MADQTPSDSPDLAAADQAAELLLTGKETLRPTVSPERESALDAAFASIPAAPASTGELGTENGGVSQPLEGAPPPKTATELEAEKAAKTEADAAAKAAAKAKEAAAAPVAPEPTKGPKGLLDDLLGDKKDATPAAPTDATQKAFDDVKLRSDASPKTQETFANLKKISLEHVAAAKAEAQAAGLEREKLAAELEEVRKKVGVLTPEVETELKELREFRALRDVENRPEIKQKFDGRIAANNEAVYNLFKAEGMSEQHLEKLKALDENARNDYIEQNVLPKLTSAQRRLVEAKLLDNVNAAEERRQAIDAAKVDADKILAEQAQAPARQRAEFDSKLVAHLKPILTRLPFMHEQEIPSTATPAEKAALEATNKFAVELQESLKRSLTEDTPESRAEVAICVPVARYYKRALDAANAELETVRAELKKINAAAATGSRLGRSAAAAPAVVAPKRGVDSDGSSEIDRLFDESLKGARP